MHALQLVFILLAVPSLAENCVAVDGPTILASDLVAILPELQALEPTTQFGYAPDFDMRRNLSPREINTVLRRHFGDRTEVNRPVCVVRKSRTVTESDIRLAVERTFAGRRVNIQILDFSKRQVGPGELNFPHQALSTISDSTAPVVWRGWYRDPVGRRTAVWAKVRLSEELQVVIAARDVAAGTQLDENAITIASRSYFPRAAQPVSPKLADFQGRCVRRAIRRGDAIPLAALENPVAIRRGDSVTVEVTVNAATLKFQGKAETAARPGQSFAVSCPNSKRVLQAKAVEKGKAIVPIPSSSHPQAH
jgi:flagella basal body P-ring formation protein FlgA